MSFPLEGSFANLSPDELREYRLAEERRHYLSPEGFLDFVKDCGAAPDAEDIPHGLHAPSIIHWDGEVDAALGHVTNYRYKMVLWPRSSFKSTVFDVGLCAWEIARNPNVRILVASETGKQARTFTNQTMQIIDSPWFRERFGVHRGKDWSKFGGFVSALRTDKQSKEPTLLGTGVGEVRTGMHWDMVIMDDVVSQENTKTPEAVETTWHWFGEILAQLDPGCRLLMIGTLHHYADLYCKIRKDKEMSKLFDFSVHGWKNSEGELFFPHRLTEDFIARQKALMPPRLFSCFYENKPTTGEEQMFRPEYFHILEDQDIPQAVWSYILTDFAFVGGQKGKDQNDRTAFWVVSLVTNRVAYVRDFRCGRWKPSDSVRLACDLWDRYLAPLHLKGILVEDTTHKELIASLFEEIRFLTYVRPRIIPVPGRSQEIKDMRIESIEPRFRGGNIYFAQSVHDSPHWRTMFNEMTEWPFSEHDDIPDAISDIDKRDQKGYYLCKEPPPTFQPVRGVRHVPHYIDGQYNKKMVMDPREFTKMTQMGPRGGELWKWQPPSSSRESGAQEENIFRRPAQRPKQWPVF